MEANGGLNNEPGVCTVKDMCRRDHPNKWISHDRFNVP